MWTKREDHSIVTEREVRAEPSSFPLPSLLTWAFTVAGSVMVMAPNPIDPKCG